MHQKNIHSDGFVLLLDHIIDKDFLTSEGTSSEKYSC